MVKFLERREGGMVFSSRDVGLVWFCSSRDVEWMTGFLEKCKRLRDFIEIVGMIWPPRETSGHGSLPREM